MAVKINWKMDGFTQLRKDPALVKQIDDLAGNLAERAGRGFEVKTREDDRYRAIVFTDTPRAMVVNARDNTLIKALGGG
ncbi:hypothetical protein [Corynebacterium tapiri]|uniref:Uncharacterized protein n=1 Tax=Corynebacterium tapiri TaxID=1448266 RepID=A0A5C4U5V7_9CORY|nr:hypothetical protein [Corynebacterium tapiri]TNL98776.1 hypothetical protein FHE74_03925 [Corynebacterium tapiri]